MGDSKPQRLKGAITASLTILDEDLGIDAAATIGHAAWLLENGSTGVLLFGSTGEANSFSLDERLALIDAVAKSDLPPERLMIGTGCCAVPDSVRLTRAALELGAAGCVVLPPFYYKNVADDGVYAAMAQLMDAVGDPRLNLYLYHFPQLSGVPFSHDVIARLFEAYPGVVCGIKDSSGDFSNMKAMIERFEGFDVFAGTERYLLDVLRLGGPGTISATLNMLSPLAGRVAAADPSGAEAEALQEQLTAQRLVLQEYPVPPACKALLVRQGRPAHYRRVRPPFVELDAARTASLVERLEAAAFVPPAIAAE